MHVGAVVEDDLITPVLEPPTVAIDCADADTTGWWSDLSKARVVPVREKCADRLSAGKCLGSALPG